MSNQHCSAQEMSACFTWSVDKAQVPCCDDDGLYSTENNLRIFKTDASG